MNSRLFYIIMGFFLVNNLPLVNHESDSWWQIDAVVSVGGSYEYFKDNQSFSGEYSFNINWLGSMERDNGDYLLYQGEVDIKNLEWQEIISVPGLKKEILTLRDEVSLELNLAYVLRRGKKLCFSLEICSLKVPQRSFGRQKILRLPWSAERDGIDLKFIYKKGILKGSNKLCFPEKFIYRQQSILKEFNWQWQEKSPDWKNFHQVEILIRLKKRTAG